MLIRSGTPSIPAGYDSRWLPEDFSLFRRASLLSEVAIAECGTPIVCNLDTDNSDYRFHYHCTTPIDAEGYELGKPCFQHTFADADAIDQRVWKAFKSSKVSGRITMSTSNPFRRRARLMRDIALVRINTDSDAPTVSQWVTWDQANAGDLSLDLETIVEGFGHRLAYGHELRLQGQAE